MLSIINSRQSTISIHMKSQFIWSHNSSLSEVSYHAFIPNMKHFQTRVQYWKCNFSGKAKFPDWQTESLLTEHSILFFYFQWVGLLQQISSAGTTQIGMVLHQLPHQQSFKLQRWNSLLFEQIYGNCNFCKTLQSTNNYGICYKPWITKEEHYAISILLLKLSRQIFLKPHIYIVNIKMNTHIRVLSQSQDAKPCKNGWQTDNITFGVWDKMRICTY